MEINKNITIDLLQKTYNIVDVVQNDTGRTITFTILNGGVAFDLTGLTIRAYSSTNYYKNLDILSAANGICKMKIDSKMINKFNDIDLQLRITDGTNIITSFSIILKAEKSLISDGAIQSSDELSALDEALNEVKAWDNYFKDTSGKLEQKYTDRLNELEKLKGIGIRNLFKNSRYFDSNWESSNASLINNDGSPGSNYRGLTYYTTSKNWGSFRQYVSLEQGKTYTLGVYLKSTVQGVNVNYYCSIDYDSSKNYGGNVTNDVSLDWQRYTVTFTAEVTENTILRVEPSNIESLGGTLYVCGYCIIEGTEIPKDYFQALEDFNSYILISGKDIQEIEESGRFKGIGCANAPNSNSWWYYIVMYHSYSYRKILAFNYSNKTFMIKTCDNDSWSEWVNPFETKNLIQDSSNRLVTDAEKNNWDNAAKIFSTSGDSTIKPSLNFSTVGYNHIDIYFSALNKTNVNQFKVYINGNEINNDTGGGKVYIRISLSRASVSTEKKWIGIYEVGMTNTGSSGNYTDQRMIEINDEEIYSLSINSDTSESFEGYRIIAKPL